jgi:hypothetical protein
VIADELGSHGVVSPDERHSRRQVLLGGQFGNAILVPGIKDRQLPVCPVGELRTGANELATVVAERFEVVKDLPTAMRKEALTSRHDTGDRHGVDEIGLALRRGLLPLSVRREWRDLDDALAMGHEESG